ncbi:uncharacterized protein LOC124348341 isoform X2 [Daphnia pulicaria]|uniref:uncharacterized protein LOC124348341 isoform X2 n=1 Tax=Daphnia pulicaria TaxID=35523 RepID=UPI001EEB9CD7|nr:uncharacterized protein LOC124348341 isoform X2 [Daphnia pulicaria]
MKMSSESDFNSDFNESVENDVAGKRLKKAKAQRKKEIQKLKNLLGRTIKKKKEETKKRLTAFKEVFKGAKEKETRNEPWDVLEYQNYWNGLTEREQNNMDRAKSHLIESINSKITEAATKYNASMLLLARLPNGTQHTKFILASGGGIDYCKEEDGTLTQHLWERHWDKVQGKRIKLCQKEEVWLSRKSKKNKIGNMRKGKTDKVLNKKNPTSDTEEDCNLGEDGGRSDESDVDKKNKRKKEKKRLSRERKGKGKKKGEIKGTGNGEARVEDFLEQRPGSPPARSPSMSPTPSNHPFPLMATPTSSSPPVTTNFQLVLSDDNESSGYFTLKPASPSIDKKLSMECQVIVEKLPPCLATGKGRRTGTKTEKLPPSSRGKGRRTGTKTEDKASSQISPITKKNKLKTSDVYSSSD